MAFLNRGEIKKLLARLEKLVVVGGESNSPDSSRYNPFLKGREAWRGIVSVCVCIYVGKRKVCLRANLKPIDVASDFKRFSEFLEGKCVR